jgi:hypothetical protein
MTNDKINIDWKMKCDRNQFINFIKKQKTQIFFSKKFGLIKIMI